MSSEAFCSNWIAGGKGRWRQLLFYRGLCAPERWIKIPTAIGNASNTTWMQADSVALGVGVIDSGLKYTLAHYCPLRWLPKNVRTAEDSQRLIRVVTWRNRKSKTINELPWHDHVAVRMCVSEMECVEASGLGSVHYVEILFCIRILILWCSYVERSLVEYGAAIRRVQTFDCMRPYVVRQPIHTGCHMWEPTSTDFACSNWICISFYCRSLEWGSNAAMARTEQKKSCTSMESVWMKPKWKQKCRRKCELKTMYKRVVYSIRSNNFPYIPFTIKWTMYTQSHHGCAIVGHFEIR